MDEIKKFFHEIREYLATLTSAQKIRYAIMFPFMILVFGTLSVLMIVGEGAESVGKKLSNRVFVWILGDE